MKTFIFITIMSVTIGIGAVVWGQDTSDLVANEVQGGVKELLAGIAARDKALAEKDKSIAKLEAAFEEINRAFKQKVKELKSVTRSDALDTALADKQKALEQRDSALKARDAALQQRDETQKKYDEYLLESTERTRKLQEELADKDDSLKKLQNAVGIKDSEIARLTSELDAARVSTSKERFALAYNLGCIYKAAKQYRKAEREFIKALDINPDDSSVHYNLGILYDDNLDESKKARKHYERFLELAPNDPDAPNVAQWIKEL
jgi:tetratricopeptide (TPR) repeat protein